MKKSKKLKKQAVKRPKSSGKKIDIPTEIFGVKISSSQISQVLSKIWLQRREMLHVATANPEYIMEARTNTKFRELLNNCLTVADGHGIVWAFKILYKANIARISGVSLVSEILEHANLYGEKVFLLGARKGVAEKAASAMGKRYPLAHFSWFEGAQTVVVEKSEESSMTIAKINGFEPDYLLVAYGSPWQDLWIEENRPYLRARVALGVGGVFDEWAGVVKECPAWIDQAGFKWAWRLVTEPWRWRRIARVWHFGFLVLIKKLRSLL